MKFDVIIGNPPYQENDSSGRGNGAKALYNSFVEMAIRLKPTYVSMVIPAKWYTGGKGLDQFRKLMLNNDSIQHIIDYPKSIDVFPDIALAGGVCCFLINNSYHGKCLVENRYNGKLESMYRWLNDYDIFIRYNKCIQIIEKIQRLTGESLVSVTNTRNTFGIDSYVRGQETRVKETDIILKTSGGIGYIDIETVKKNSELIDKYKVITGILMPDRAGTNNTIKYNVINMPSILEPGAVCTETYNVVHSFGVNERYKAENFLQYLKTKFTRFLILMTLTSIHITAQSYQFVPMQDFNEQWTDEKLYEKYGLIQEEIKFIESLIKTMG